MTEPREPKPQPPPHREGKVLITGGAGFIGANLADRLLAAGQEVVVLDSFVHDGAEENAAWLSERHGSRVAFRRGDVRDRAAVQDALEDAVAVYHFAAQVTVTASLTDH